MTDQTFNNLTVLDSLIIPGSTGTISTKNDQLFLNKVNQSSAVYANVSNRPVITCEDEEVNINLKDDKFVYFNRDKVDFSNLTLVTEGDVYVGALTSSGINCPNIYGTIIRPEQENITKIGPQDNLRLNSEMQGNNNNAVGFKTLGTENLWVRNITGPAGMVLNNILQVKCISGTLEGAKQTLIVPWSMTGNSTFDSAGYWSPNFPTRFTTTGPKRWYCSYNLVVKPLGNLANDVYLMAYMKKDSTYFVEGFDSRSIKAGTYDNITLKGSAMFDMGVNNLGANNYIEVTIAVRNCISNFALTDRLGSVIIQSSFCLQEVERLTSL